jgi:hypothetical protein
VTIFQDKIERYHTGYSYVEMQPQVLLVGVREALAKKTSFQYNVYWLPTANKIVKDVFYV